MPTNSGGHVPRDFDPARRVASADVRLRARKGLQPLDLSPLQVASTKSKHLRHADAFDVQELGERASGIEVGLRAEIPLRDGREASRRPRQLVEAPCHA